MNFVMITSWWKKYGKNSKKLFTDIDSLMYEIKTEDAYENFSKDKEISYFGN